MAASQSKFSPRRRLLEETSDLIDGDRNAQYGSPTGDFVAISEMWTSYIQRRFSQFTGNIEDFAFKPHDVAVLMALVKVSRIGWSPTKKDHWADLAGYAACGWECIETEAQSNRK
jgi:hypothetical protein